MLDKILSQNGSNAFKTPFKPILPCNDCRLWLTTEFSIGLDNKGFGFGRNKTVFGLHVLNPNPSTIQSYYQKGYHLPYGKVKESVWA